MSQRIFLAGATGALGRCLAPMLIADGWQVVGTTRSASRQQMLHDMGVVPVVVDVFDRGRLEEAAVQARPDVVIHQLSDLPAGLDPDRMGDALVRNVR